MCVTTIAIPALPLAATADPALNPNQPTLPQKRKMHSMITTKEKDAFKDNDQENASRGSVGAHKSGGVAPG